MILPAPFLLCIAAAMLATPAAAQHWFAVEGVEGTARHAVLEVDLDTVGQKATTGETVIRVTFDVLQPHPAGYGFRSFVATARIDCQSRTLALSSAAYFAQPAGQGMRVGADSSGRAAGMPPELVEKIPAPARQALLRAACVAPS